MNSSLRRRASLLLVAALGFSAAALAGPVAPVAAVPASYTCSSPDFNEGQTLDVEFALNTTAPATMYVARSTKPTLVVQATIPGNIVGIAALFGIKSASATGTFTVKVNGVARALPLSFPRTDIPQSATDFPVTIPVPLPTLTRRTAGSVVYTPGSVALSLTGYNRTTAAAEPGDEVGSIAANCDPANPDAVIDTVRFVRSATATRSAVSYAKAAKKVTAVARVSARSGVAPTGRVRVVLFKGTKKVAARSVRLVGGRATTVFRRVSAKGTYKVVTTYSGNAALLGSRATRTFTRR